MPFVKEGDESNPDVSSLYKEIDDELKIGKDSKHPKNYIN